MYETERVKWSILLGDDTMVQEGLRVTCYCCICFVWCVSAKYACVMGDENVPSIMQDGNRKSNTGFADVG